LQCQSVDFYARGGIAAYLKIQKKMFFIIYIIFILICVIFWLKTKNFQPKESSKSVSLSLVVCCRNEEENLPFLLPSIETQIADIKQIIFINDNSTDKTLEILEQFSQKSPKIIVCSAEGEGKKNALRKAIQLSDNEYVFCTDADCILPKNYFSLLKNFLANNQPDLMIGGVRLKCLNGGKNAFQALEFASLQASAAGAALAGMPIMCNGANLAFRREMGQNAQNHLVDDEISGDDVFLLHFVKKINGKIFYLKTPNSFVQTLPAKSFGEFCSQRKRWASKSRSYTDWQTILTALAVFFVNLEIILLAILSIFIPFIRLIFFAVFFVKLLIDSILLMPFLKFSKQIKLIPLIPILAVIYPFYVVFTAIFGIFGNFSWKSK
jgi:cellulose synthase/poly-beta-1,6-N-acetylglucosamine synthase-like glycosyltransferase